MSAQDIIKSIEDAQLREVAEFKTGDTVRVHAKVKEGNRERVQIFEGTVVHHIFNKGNVSLVESYIISSKGGNTYSYGIYLDNESIANSTAIFEDNNTYSVGLNQEEIGTIEYQNASFTNNTQSFYYDGHVIEIRFENSTANSIKHITNINQGFFINLNL